jgi:hypothetical protein
VSAEEKGEVVLVWWMLDDNGNPTRSRVRLIPKRSVHDCERRSGG